MSTPAQLAQYCVDHHYVLQTQGKHMNSFLIPGTLAFDALIAVGGYLVGHFGIPAIWSVMKSGYAKVRSVVSSTPTAA